MIPRQVPAPPWAPVVLYACTPLENSRRLAVDSLRRCALERQWRVAGECTDALPLTAGRRPRWDAARQLIDTGTASGLVVPSRLTASPTHAQWPRLDAWLRERDAFLAVLDPMPPGPAGACVYGDGWADTSVIVGHNGLWPEHAHPTCVQPEKPVGPLVLPRRIRTPRPPADDRPAATTWNITDLLKAPAWGPERATAAEQRMTDDLTRLLHNADPEAGQADRAGQVVQDSQAGPAGRADGPEGEGGDGEHVCDHNCDLDHGGTPEGWCVYGDGWARPALVLPYHPVLSAPGWPRYAHPECHARALAGAGNAPPVEPPGDLAGPSCGLDGRPACRGRPRARAEPDEGGGAADDEGGR